MKHLIFIFVLVIKCTSVLFAQGKGTHAIAKSDAALEEKVIFTTDRTLYFSGEKILFKANRMLPDFPNDTLLSNVLYLELYDKKDKAFVQKKEQILHGVSSGHIEIPTDMVTGNYYLRAYTQYMRNFRKELFYTTQLTIINPELPAKEMIQTLRCKKDTLVKDTDNGLEIITAKDIFSPRSLITIHLKGPAYTDVSVSVVKKGSYEEENTGINYCFKPAWKTDTASDVRWHPEIRSVSLSGKVIDKKTRQALKNVLVYACLVDNGNQFHLTRTKNDGTFIFSLPNLNENHKIYICAQKQEDKETVVLINRDFSSVFPQVDYVQANIDSNKISLINEMYMNYQVAKNSTSNMEIKKSFLDPLPLPFSGKFETIILKEYVDLPEMTDIFNEVVPYTHVKKSKKNVSIQLFDKRTRIIFPQPLILLDGIPFQNDSALLSLPPSKIVSVGVMAEPFVHGSEIIYGILDIKSADGDLAGLKLPENLEVVDYITYNPLTSTQFKEYKKEEYPTNRDPDFRNTLYWNPSVQWKEGNAALQFYASDYTSDYEIVVRGADENGKLILKTKTIKVNSTKP